MGDLSTSPWGLCDKEGVSLLYPKGPLTRGVVGESLYYTLRSLWCGQIKFFPESVASSVNEIKIPNPVSQRILMDNFSWCSAPSGHAVQMVLYGFCSLYQKHQTQYKSSITFLLFHFRRYLTLNAYDAQGGLRAGVECTPGRAVRGRTCPWNHKFGGFKKGVPSLKKNEGPYQQEPQWTFLRRAGDLLLCVACPICQPSIRLT